MTKDFIKYNHGRNTEETKEIYNYMLSALYNFRQILEGNFDEKKFYEEVFKLNMLNALCKKK